MTKSGRLKTPTSKYDSMNDSRNLTISDQKRLIIGSRKVSVESMGNG